MQKRNTLASPLVLASLVLIVSSGCTKRPQDTAIETDIQKQIAADPDTKDAPVKVASNSGKVTLSGSVTSPQARQKVNDMAHAEPGVTEVDDRIAVQPAGAAAAQNAATPSAPEAQPAPQPIVVPAGTALAIRTTNSLSSKTSETGQSFVATLAQPADVGGQVVLPKGTTVNGKVVAAEARGRIKGEGRLALQLTSLSINGRTYEIQTGVLDSTIKGKGKWSAGTTAGGAAGGALIGGLAGGGKGAGIGLLAGAGAGLLGGALTGNKQVVIPAESVLTFTLSAPLTLPPAR